MKTAIITGGTRGIGRAIALALGTSGYHVFFNYISSDDMAESLIKEIEYSGGSAVAFKGDISKYETAKEFFQIIKDKVDSIDVLVNNAGITRDGFFIRMSEEDFDRVIEVNLKGVFHCSKLCAKKFMKQKRGKIINISSISGIRGNIGQANYCASKAGVIGLTKAMARELAMYNVTVNAVAPGYIQTDMTSQIPEVTKESIVKEIPLKRIGQPNDIANIVMFLASDMADYITGQVIAVDGGITM